MGLTRDAILSADDLPRREVPCPEWGGSVWVRSITLAERLELMPLVKSDGDITAEMVALCACDEAGTRLFALDDAQRLKAKSAAVVQRVALAALELNGLTKGAAEGAEKN